MGVLKGFLFFCAAAFGLGALLVLKFFGLGLFTLLAAAGFGALAYLTFVQAKKFGSQSDAGMKVQFEQTVRRLADKNGGIVALQAVMNATGEDQPGAQAKMKELIGRGVCEMDFGPNGEMQFKLTPMDEARANLASMSDKSR